MNLRSPVIPVRPEGTVVLKTHSRPFPGFQIPPGINIKPVGGTPAGFSASSVQIIRSLISQDKRIPNVDLISLHHLILLTLLFQALSAPGKKKEKYACFLDISTGETVSVFGEALPVSREAASVSRQRNFTGSAHMLSICMTKELPSREHALRRCPLAFNTDIIASQAAVIKNLLRRICIPAAFRF